MLLSARLNTPSPRSQPGRAWLVTFVVTLALADSVQAQSHAAEYTLSFANAAQHYVDVRMEVPKVADDSLELTMATWTPGSYFIRDYARNVDSIRAEDAAGHSLEIEKTTKNRWRVSGTRQRKVIIHYRLYCREMSVRTNFVDAEFAILNGAATFVTVVGQLDRPHRLQIDLPRGWRRAATALDLQANVGAQRYVARDFDHLVDSPILVGNPEVHSFQVGGHQHQLVNLGGNGLWDGAKASGDVAQIVAEQQKIWGKIPYRAYWFLNVIAEAGGGLEHDESTLMMTSRWSFRDESAYRRWLGLVSHEFFHVWNIRTMRPRQLVEYDYERENYFRSLWIAEGITSYYDDLCLARAGLVTEEEYVKLLSRQIERLQATPGRKVQSLSDSSHDAWIKFYQSDEHSSNAQISYYTKGAVVAFLLDAKIRRATNNQKSLDHVLRTVYQRYAGSRGYTERDFRQVASQVSGLNLAEWFQHAVDSTAELEYAEALDWVGLEFEGNPKEPEDQSGSAKSQAQPPEDKPFQPWTGLRLRQDNGRLVITGVEQGTPGYDAGLNVEDELIGVERYRVTEGNLERVLKQIGLGETATLLVARRGELREIRLPIQAKPTLSFKLRKLKKATDQQIESRRRWLGRETDAQE